MRATRIKSLVAATALTVAMAVTNVVPASAADTSNSWAFRFTNPKTSVYVGEMRRDAGSLYNDIRGNEDDIIYKSSNPKVATVNTHGNITGKKVGTATITVTDGDHTSKCKVTVQPASKAGKKDVVFNYQSGVNLEYKKTYTLKTLAGSKIKKISNVSGAKVKGKQFTITKKSGCTIKVTLANNKTYKLHYHVNCLDDYSCCLPTRTRAKNIIKNDMSKYGVSMESSDLEKVAFAWNWIGDNMTHAKKTGAGVYRDHEKCDYCYSIGKDCGIINGVGDCDVYAEAFATICETLGVWTVYVWNNKGGADHLYNGVRVDGEWYLIDTSWCSGWHFTRFLMSEDYFLNHYNVVGDKGSAFKPAKNACSDIKFTSTKYDDCDWSKYFPDYEELFRERDKIYNPDAYEEDDDYSSGDSSSDDDEVDDDELWF